MAKITVYHVLATTASKADRDQLLGWLQDLNEDGSLETEAAIQVTEQEMEIDDES